MNNRLLTLAETDLWYSFLDKIPVDRKDIYFAPAYYSLYQNYGDGEAQCFVFEMDEDFALYPFLKNL